MFLSLFSVALVSLNSCTLSIIQHVGLTSKSKTGHAVGSLFLRRNYRNLLSVKAGTCINKLLMVLASRQNELVLGGQVV